MNDPIVTAAAFFATAVAALTIHIMVMLAFRHLYLRLVPATFDRIMGTFPAHPDWIYLNSLARFGLKALVAFALLPFLVGMFLCLALLSDWKQVDGQLLLLPHFLHLLSDKRMLGFFRLALKA